MQKLSVSKTKNLLGDITVPGDKSISHRAVMLSAISEGKVEIKNFLWCDDCERTVDAFRKMAVEIQIADDKKTLFVQGVGLRGLKKPQGELYLGNSGTTMRLLAGILAGQDFEVTLTGDESLSKRPMKRIVEPLRLMGADITGPDDGAFAPLTIKGKKLRAIDYKTNVASAQVKSAILLAGLYAKGVTKITEPSKSRDHTEKMLEYLDCRLEMVDGSVLIEGGQQLKARDIDAPGDISSAAYFIVAGAMLEDSQIKINSVGINPTRIGILEILQRMGARIKIENKRSLCNEMRADITVGFSRLKSAVIEKDLIPKAIDELPVLMVCATQARGETLIKGASELRVKETDRINSIVTNLRKMGADIEVIGDDIKIKGPTKLIGTEVDSFNDHRTAMSMVIAGLCAEGETAIKDTDCIAISFPEFIDTLQRLGVNYLK